MFNLTWPSLVNGAENVALFEAKTRSKRGRVVNMIPTLNIVTYYIDHCKAKEITSSKILDTTPKYRARWLTAGPFTAAIRGLGKSISSET